MRKKIYLDNAAATPMDSRVFRAMRPYMTSKWGNPSALYTLATQAQQAVQKSRNRIAGVLSAEPDTIIFTSGGTEANNIALQGAAYAHETHGRHIITTEVEHPSVLETCKFLERRGFEITYLPVDKNGLVSTEKLSKSLRTDTILVSIMYANSEVGSIQPICDIGREILKWRKIHGPYPIFHTDACQAAGYLPLTAEKLHTDLMSINSGKIYGPSGVGVLYKRRGVELRPLMYGGGQENGLRPGTENVAGAIGMAKALSICAQKYNSEKICELRNLLWREIERLIPVAELNGPPLDGPRLPNNLNIFLPGIESQKLALYLDARGFMAGTGSACASRKMAGSHVLKGLGYPDARARESIRFTLSKYTTARDVMNTAKILSEIVKSFKTTMGYGTY